MNLLDGLYLVGVGALAPWWMRKSRADWRERMGHAEVLGKSVSGRPRIMLHAVSVGEVSALRHLVPIMAAKCELVLSVGTDTGIRRARELFARDCTIVRYPLDFSWSVRRFLDAVKPDAVGLVELELWPNFVKECSNRGIPVAVINGRLSERSFKGYRRVRSVLSPTFARLTFAAVQDEAYRQRFLAMGVPSERCTITGSMKWDAATITNSVEGAEELAREMGIDRSRPLVVAGSTAEDEEALLHAACPPGVQLLCAPRKPERFDEAAGAMPGCVRRSEKRTAAPGTNRFVLDTIGELRKAYALADVVVMGRSFGSLYGSDPIEPAALGKPVVIGPMVKDFQSIIETMDAADAIVRTTREKLGAELARLITDGAMRIGLAGSAIACVRANQGASVRHAEMLLSLPGRPATGA